jgi:hypothetical protein
MKPSRRSDMRSEHVSVTGKVKFFNETKGLDSLNTCNSGASAPTNQLSGAASLGNCWLNTTGIPYPWQVYDGTSWLTPFWIDAGNHVTNVKIGGGVATVASAATVDLCAASGNVAPRAYVTITGTTTITSFGPTCNAGHVKFVTFTGALTLAYNATSLIIPGGQNVTTTAGDQAVLMALGGGNWQVAFYQPANGQALLNPAIDVGAIEWTFSPNVPSSKYLWAYGQAVSRTTYGTLLTALTIAQSVTATNGSPTLTGFSDTTQIAAGAAIEATFVPAGLTITSCTTTTCTMSGNATASTTGGVTIFNYGNGCGAGASCASPSTNFNLPDCRGVTLAGRDNMGGTPKALLTSTYFGTNPDALGALGGAQNVTIAQSGLPNVTLSIPSGQGSHSHGDPGGGSFITSGGNDSIVADLVGSGATLLVRDAGSTTSVTLPAMNTASINGGVAQTPTAVVQPTLTANCMIRVLANGGLVGQPLSSLAANDDAPDALAIIDRRRFAA